MQAHEIHQLQDIEGYTESIRYALRDEAMAHSAEHGGRVYWMSDAFPKRRRPLFLIAHLICYVVRMLVMIFHKLDALEGHAIEQTMRERNREGR